MSELLASLRPRELKIIKALPHEDAAFVPSTRGEADGLQWLSVYQIVHAVARRPVALTQAVAGVAKKKTQAPSVYWVLTSVGKGLYREVHGGRRGLGRRITLGVERNPPAGLYVTALERMQVRLNRTADAGGAEHRRALDDIQSLVMRAASDPHVAAADAQVIERQAQAIIAAPVMARGFTSSSRAAPPMAKRMKRTDWNVYFGQAGRRYNPEEDERAAPHHVCYLLHFDDGTHYVGTSGNLEQRIAAHMAGHGALHVRYKAEHGQHFVVARKWEGFATHGEARVKEKAVKNSGGGGRRAACPICKAPVPAACSLNPMMGWEHREVPVYQGNPFMLDLASGGAGAVPRVEGVGFATGYVPGVGYQSPFSAAHAQNRNPTWPTNRSYGGYGSAPKLQCPTCLKYIGKGQRIYWDADRVAYHWAHRPEQLKSNPEMHYAGKQVTGPEMELLVSIAQGRHEFTGPLPGSKRTEAQDTLKRLEKLQDKGLIDFHYNFTSDGQQLARGVELIGPSRAILAQHIPAALTTYTQQGPVGRALGPVHADLVREQLAAHGQVHGLSPSVQLLSPQHAAIQPDEARRMAIAYTEAIKDDPKLREKQSGAMRLPAVSADLMAEKLKELKDYEKSGLAEPFFSKEHPRPGYMSFAAPAMRRAHMKGMGRAVARYVTRGIGREYRAVRDYDPMESNPAAAAGGGLADRINALWSRIKRGR